MTKFEGDQLVAFLHYAVNNRHKLRIPDNFQEFWTKWTRPEQKYSIHRNIHVPTPIMVPDSTFVYQSIEEII
jgi:hypothetical protein